jgi:hypothetical protein
MPWTVTVTAITYSGERTATYERVIEVLIGHHTRFSSGGSALLRLETLDGAIEEQIKQGDRVLMTWQP